MKKLMMATIAGAMAMAGAAQAGDWLLANMSEGLVVGIDQSGVRRAGDKVTFWSVWVSESAETVGDVTFDYYVTRLTLDCVEDIHESHIAVFYRLNAVDAVYRETGITNPEYFTPDSILGGLARVACAHPGPYVGRGMESASTFATAMREDWPAIASTR